MPEAIVILPLTCMVILEAPAKVPVNPVKVILKISCATVTVTVFAPLPLSKNTSSPVPGTACPPAPPLVSAHLEPAVPSQFAVPPTQCLCAIFV
jgi:hypothetical protein